MTLFKLLLLAFGPPLANWIVGRLWFRYRELLLSRLVFWAWLVMFMPAVILIITGVAHAVDQVIQMEHEDTPEGETLPAVFDWGRDDDKDDKASLPDAPAESTGYGMDFVDFDWVIGRGRYPLRASHYDPSLCYDANGRVIANTNCDSDPTTMASGDATFSWTGGKNGILASACANRPDLGWTIGSASQGTAGTRFTAGGSIYECRDTGGWIKCYDPGDYDPAIANAHASGYLLDQPEIAAISYCWVDLYSDPLVPYGQFVIDWSFGELVVDTAVSTPSGPLTMATAVKLLYMGSQPSQSQGWHPSVQPLPGAEDWAAGCGTPIYSPVPGKATVTYVGDDGLNVGTTMIVIEGAGGKVTLLHGDYTALQGSTVVGGVTQIGSEASNGNSSGCHSHVAPGPWSR